MAHTSWRDEYGVASFPNFYKPAFLKYILGRIEDRNLLMAAYKGDEIVSFFANLPHRFHFKGKIYRGVLTCILVTRKEQLRRGIAEAMIRQAVDYNKQVRYDFALLTLESGHRSTRLVKKLERAGGPLSFVKKQHIVVRILDLDRVSASEGMKGWERAAIKLWRAHVPPTSGVRLPLREYRPEDIDDCLALLNRYKDHVTLARVWDRDELAWELFCPGVSQTLVYEKDGRVKGLINFIYYDHLGKTSERWAWFNHVAFPGLASRERCAFIRSYLHYIHAAGCVGTVEWTRKYYPLGPLYRSRFFPYPRSVKMWAWNFNPEVIIKDIPDVYEVQI
jgi:GNAT superfamily N-acetyltransferase